MKLRYLFAGIAAAFTLVVSGCTKSKSNEEAALENFKKETKTLDVWMEEKRKAAGQDRNAMLAVMKELVAKLKAVKTDDLPADLKDAWTGSVATLVKMESVFSEMVSDAAIKKAASDPKYMQEFGERMKGIQGEMQSAGDRLSAAGEKYGIKIGEFTPK